MLRVWSRFSDSASERRGNNLGDFHDLYLQVKARIWPRLSYMCHVRSTAERGEPCGYSGWRGLSPSERPRHPSVLNTGLPRFLMLNSSGRRPATTLEPLASEAGTPYKKKNFLENGSNQGQDLAVDVLCVPNWLDRGPVWMLRMSWSAALSFGVPGLEETAVGRIWHIHDSHGQILALASR